MDGHRHLPTWVSGKWKVAAFRSSLISTLKADRSCSSLSMYFYAVTRSGWDQIREPVLRWKASIEERTVILFVGTDHGVTDPSALKQISEDGVDVRVMLRYHGVFHPKVVWLHGRRRHVVWVGSNNLTRDGLLNNVEFALLVRARKAPGALDRWAHSINSASTGLTDDLLKSYENQRRKFENDRAKGKAATFTWRKKVEPAKAKSVPATDVGNLIVEVMPRETGGDGRQLQLPVKAASTFFGVAGVGSTRTIELRSKNSPSVRTLTITVFGNNTVRIVISELEYRDRPCILVFRKMPNSIFEYEIVPESIFPSRYKTLLALCKNRTRYGSRRWGIA